MMQLPEVMDLKAAAPLADQLIKRRGQPIVLDASRVQRIGGLCLQVVLSARDTWNADGLPFSVANPSAAFLESLELFGADADHLGNARE